MVNVGVAGFAISLLGDWTIGKRIFAPIMGTGLLLGLGIFAYGLLPQGTREPALEPESAPGG
jgi:hypothetical protein